MKKSSSRYIVALIFLTLVIMGSQILMQTTIKASKSDSRIINISGRQRMLSQKITKASLKMLKAENERTFNLAKEELSGAFTLWSQSHEDLQYGSEEIDVSEMNTSQELILLYDDIQPYFSKIKEAASFLSGLSYGVADNGADEAVDQISANEADFLNLMNKITFQYDRQASKKIERLAEVDICWV